VVVGVAALAVIVSVDRKRRRQKASSSNPPPNDSKLGDAAAKSSLSSGSPGVAKDAQLLSKAVTPIVLQPGLVLLKVFELASVHI